MTQDHKAAVREIDDVLREYDEHRKTRDDLSDLSVDLQVKIVSLIASAVSRLATPGTTYRQQIETLIGKGIIAQHTGMTAQPAQHMLKVLGLLRALRAEHDRTP